jgi:molybdopterin molybdotransferase
VALGADNVLTPAAVSYLAGMGVDQVSVYANPVVRIISTGKELTAPGKPLAGGMIYESNSCGLSAGLKHAGISASSVNTCDDVEDQIVASIRTGLESDVLLITGGVSAGDYDLVPGALGKCGVRKVFHKVKQKPGKPFFFGTHESTLVFALPGNPAAVMTCFYEYVLPAIAMLRHEPPHGHITSTLADEYHKKEGLTHFLKGKSNNGTVTILSHQESYLMNTFAVADCLIEMDEDKAHFNIGDTIRITPLW